jgi:excisionase family DNA binding protein
MRLLTIPEVSDLLRVPKARAYALARGGVIPVVHVGRQVRVREEALAAWIGRGGCRLSPMSGSASQDASNGA